ncbi:Fic family protein [Sphingobacterium sp. SG20118]|uniref:Fic family protein n=1 Tax=Sphingobacterium sp. SG20118 TaxID=3367156 RepID=UPI0037DFC7C7
MATPKERFVEALQHLKKLQDQGIVGIHTNDLPNRKYREILIKKGFLKDVSKGWYISSNPNEKDGETTSWYTSYWDFVAKFIKHKYDNNWCLSADHSLLIHAGNRAVPQQLIILSPKGNNSAISFPHNTSLFSLRRKLLLSEYSFTTDKGLIMYDLPSALVYATPSLYIHNPIDMRTALSLIRDASEVLPILLENGHTTIAGRLAGAFRNIGRNKIADQIIDTFKQADYDIREEDPFESKLDLNFSSRERLPYANRIKLMWSEMRKVVISSFPPAPGISGDKKAYLKAIEDIYVMDAYHSLSIERYRVTPELIAKVSSGEWNTKENKEDLKQRDAMAARGYYLTFQSVKETIEAILDGKNAGIEVDKDHGKWYRELFDPSVTAGILKASDLAGYRNHQVYIGNSKHLPLNVDAMRDAMPVIFELLEQESEASVRVVLGHFIFVFIHPYMDGNGRMARFLMNTMLASGGYPWTVIPVESRKIYMEALEQASVENNIEPFALFLGDLVRKSMNGEQEATLPS